MSAQGAARRASEVLHLRDELREGLPVAAVVEQLRRQPEVIKRVERGGDARLVLNLVVRRALKR